MNPCFFTVLAVICTGGISVLAQNGDAPSWMEDVTRIPPGGHANLRSVKLGYTLSWNNRVNAGKFQISVVEPEDGTAQFLSLIHI